jgi:hypothetical protein
MFCHCTTCVSPVIRRARGGHNQEQDEWDDLLVCSQCKQDERNARRREDRYNETHGDTGNHTTLKVLLESPQKRRLRRRFNNRKQWVKLARRKQRRLNDVLHSLKSRKNSVYACKVTDTAMEGDPGALHGVVNMIVNAIARENVSKLNHSESERESTILSLLNESLSGNKQSNLSFTRDEAKEFIQAIQEEIKNYALRLVGKDKCVRFSPKVIRIAIALWLRSPAAYEELHQSNWIISLPSQDTLRKI